MLLDWNGLFGDQAGLDLTGLGYSAIKLDWTGLDYSAIKLDGYVEEVVSEAIVLLEVCVLSSACLA